MGMWAPYDIGEKNYPLPAVDVFVEALTSKYLQSSEERWFKKNLKIIPSRLWCVLWRDLPGGAEYLQGFTPLLRTEESIISTLD